MKKEDYLKYYVQSSDHYLIPKYTFEELFNEMENWREEAQKPQKQLDCALKEKEEFEKNQTTIFDFIGKD